MIAILDYGLGNIKAFANVYKRLNIPTFIVSRKEELNGATKIILPGVGSFDYAMQRFNKSGLRDSVENQVLNEGTPIIGICVGMQMLAKSSDEGTEPGLGWIDGKVKLFSTDSIFFKTKLPHMGWNEIKPGNSVLLSEINNGSRFYFLHSYYFECNNPEDSIAKTSYGFEYSSAVNHKNVYGVQFHPEKSHGNGIQVLSNFARL